MNRRDFLKISTATGAAAVLASKVRFLQRAFAAYVTQNTMDPMSIPQFASPMVIPLAMPGKFSKNKDKYKIAVRQFQQQILPTGYPSTTVWSYGSIDHPGTFNYPAFTIEATYNKDTQVQWRNELFDAMGNPLQHVVPVDPSLHWANPIGMRDTRPDSGDAAYWMHPYLNGPNGNYTGPVPMVTHVHGAHTHEDSDGYPEAWYLPPQAYADPNITYPTGTFYDAFSNSYNHNWSPGTAMFKYPNNQRATTLWYHDHTLGMTRLNVYAGPAGFYLLRGGPDDEVGGTLPSPAPGVGDDPFGSGYYEIPIVIQDRSFTDAGQLWYPLYRAFFEGLEAQNLQIPFAPDTTLGGVYSDIAPIWQPEFFADVMVVNGVSWPYLDVEPQLYRFRFLNGCNSRFLILQFDPGVPVYQIGAEGGFLPAPADIAGNSPYPGMILMAPAERADVVVDFRGHANQTIRLLNFGPDDPFGGGEIDVDFDAANPDTTGQVMEFRVGATSQLPPDAFTDPEDLVLPAITPLTPTTPPRPLSLNEEMSHFVYVPFDAGEDEFVLDSNGTLWEVAADEVPIETSPGVWTLPRLDGVVWDRPWTADHFGPAAALLGTLNPDGTGNSLLWMDPVTENPTVGSTEEWVIYNFTADAHPIHIHLVQFQVVGRFEADGVTLIGGPEPSETGFKDTVISYPDQVTKVVARFDIPGRFVWHCHIVEHEDNEMMRPYDVV
jgi:FtsP/CotA-like multicopper oxidase with cupredoxin domain